MAKLIQLNLQCPEPKQPPGTGLCGVSGNLATVAELFIKSDTVVGECPKCHRKQIVEADNGYVCCRSCGYDATGGQYALEIDFEHGLCGADRVPNR